MTDSSLVALKRTSSGAYDLTLQNQSSAITVAADIVVLTIPFAILKTSVDLSSAAFSPLKMTAINQLSMGTNSKLALQFKSRSWEKLGSNGETYSDQGYQATWEVSRAQSGEAGILVDYTGGEIGASFNVGTPAERAQQFLAEIEPVLPGLGAEWNGAVSLDYWPANPFSRGSYSFWKVGQYTSFAGVEREQEENCHFAGEHTSIDAQGYLEGGVESGERAAREVLADLSGRKF